MQLSPPFTDAEITLREFLGRERLPDTLRWIWRDSIISRRGSGTKRRANRRIFIDATRLANLTEVKRYYDAGVRQGLGLALSVFCLAGGWSCCYVDVPEDDLAAEYRMMTSLRCSIPTPIPVAKLITSRIVAGCL
ncbi:hypothetical protein [Stieleria magnilauensis]|uniref:Uncharacterized protein n=1 Tax=Stieleria magnilauensis TaxID=2527963 RepID=A0ABX5XVL3_9BACT|nr:hypothetical protein TBK1r_50640 [Planctomycetes bacterium TBK1r]